MSICSMITLNSHYCFYSESLFGLNKACSASVIEFVNKWSLTNNPLSLRDAHNYD